MNLLTLAYFKYANFGIQNFNALLVTLGAVPIGWTPILLPIGLSFYIFHAISYLVDIYRREAPPAERLLDFAAFVALFPHLIAGPVLRYKLLAQQFESRQHSLEQFGAGAQRFMVGFVKKVMVADTLAPLVQATFALPAPSASDAWLGALTFAMQLYFDFSGYTDMAIGLAAMMGFKFPENFDHPFISTSASEFFRRWHMSLSSWFRDYVFFPLERLARKGRRSNRNVTALNLLIMMVLVGFWHGANWTFLLWGLTLGLLLATELGLRRKRWWKPLPPLLKLPVSFGASLLLFVLFAAPTVQDAWRMYQGMFGHFGFRLTDNLAWQITRLELFTLAVAVALVFLGPLWERAQTITSPRWSVALWGVSLLTVPLFVLSVAKLLSQGDTPFLYFQF
ncbi:MBOAT family O-acyltransferase [Deinococcus oregonensis]|uniref:MBOAT family O-acyltransferase n=1 Tax=Deinococcus oregonensis TaxID=1805970 RepID=A0ABV6B2U1_9DEIO